MADKVDFGPRLGADPELFVTLASGERKTPIPVCGLIGGTKQTPIVVPFDHVMHKTIDKKRIGEFMHSEDNVAFEFNIPPALTTDGFTYYIYYFLDYARKMLLAPKGLEFNYSNKHRFKMEELEPHPQAMEIGCSPDFMAYGPRESAQRNPFDIKQLGRQRFCGGHLHVQYNYNNVPRHIFAQFMDLFVQLPFLALDKQGDRRKFYGLAGLYRPKEYGIEYRTLSNFWLNPAFKDGGLPRWLANNTFNLTYLANNAPNELMAAYKRVPWIDVQAAINEEDQKLAADVFRYGDKQIKSTSFTHWLNGRFDTYR